MAGNKKTISYRYDSVRNRVGMTDSDGGRFTYAYDSVNRMTHMVNPQGERTTYAYDPAGRRTVKKLANGTRTSFSYDAAGNLTRLANLKSDGTTISSFDYDYDRVGNRKAVVEADGSRVTWSYDATYQLTGEHRTGSTPYRDTYTYDASGNRTLKIHDGARTTSAYDAANQLIYSDDASGRTTYTFDADGNQEVVEDPAGDRTTYAWDYENRMSSAQLPSGVRNTMAYEPDGLRVKLEESTGTKKFVWDEQNYLAETDENDDTQVVYTNEPRLYGNLVSQRRGSNSHWYHFDAIGSTRELSDASQIITDTRLYDAWGNTINATGTSEFVFGFTGMTGYRSDNELVRLYVRERYYGPRAARWLSLDPVFLSLYPVFPDAMGTFAEHVGFNGYVLADQNPIVRIDPSGLGWCLPFVLIGACVAGVGSQCLHGITPPSFTFPDVLPPDFFDPNGRCNVDVDLVCREIEADRTGMFYHCFLAAKDLDTRLYIATVSGSPENWQGDPGTTIKTEFTEIPQLELIEIYDHGRDYIRVPFSSWDDPCTFFECANRYATEISGLFGYDQYVDNSNTFLTRVIRACGGQADFPFRAIGSDDIPTVIDRLPYDDCLDACLEYKKDYEFCSVRCRQHSF